MALLNLAYFAALIVLLYVIYAEYKENEMKHAALLGAVLVVNIFVWLAKQKCKKDLDDTNKDLDVCGKLVKKLVADDARDKKRQ